MVDDLHRSNQHAFAKAVAEVCCFEGQRELGVRRGVGRLDLLTCSLRSVHNASTTSSGERHADADVLRLQQFGWCKAGLSTQRCIRVDRLTVRLPA